MTQAFNLSQFANKLNSSGQTDNTGLQNSAVTVTAGTGMSGGGSVALGSSVTLTNAGVTSLTAGTGISVSAGTGGVTITNTSPGTSYSAGTGISISGGVITNTAPAVITAGSVGSYAFGASQGSKTFGSSYSGLNVSGITQYCSGLNIESSSSGSPSLSGTWRAMGYALNGNIQQANFVLYVRIS